MHPYFQAYDIVVPINTQLRQELSKPEVSGLLKTWSIELSEFDIEYVPCTTIKNQVLVDFIAKIPYKELYNEENGGEHNMLMVLQQKREWR